ncbi:unnamed protein product [Ceratitis capitata]|uniref:(Mediterranean fruit fly) hypothetical protein n=1 Tax=Ceratitis capitata TaxID=7213 RepID=A0A811U1R7_CERCA|nr:unnamed protein product [Ceratitis capitata]
MYERETIAKFTIKTETRRKDVDSPLLICLDSECQQQQSLTHQIPRTFHKIPAKLSNASASGANIYHRRCMDNQTQPPAKRKVSEIFGGRLDCQQQQ